jgi:phosphate transport system substrate-binding protein
MNIKKVIGLVSLCAVVGTIFAGCTNTGGNQNTFDKTKSISVVSREEGSGTRVHFIELLGIEQKQADGTKVDKTTKEATVVNSTEIVLTNVSTNAYAIGYISLGSLNSSVKALKVNGVTASAENVKNKTYTIARPFNIATKGEVTGLSKDFMDFILSKEGQDVVNSSGYIKINDKASAFTSTKPTGKIVIAGSSSVTPVMEKLKEAYLKINTGAQIEIQQSDSTTGMTAAMNGTANIGMASRDLKDSEKAVLKNTEIALDGIAIIVNTQNTLTDITSDAIKNIFMGTLTKWSDIIKITHMYLLYIFKMGGIIRPPYPFYKKFIIISNNLNPKE